MLLLDEYYGRYQPFDILDGVVTFRLRDAVADVDVEIQPSQTATESYRMYLPGALPEVKANMTMSVDGVMGFDEPTIFIPLLPTSSSYASLGDAEVANDYTNTQINQIIAALQAHGILLPTNVVVTPEAPADASAESHYGTIVPEPATATATTEYEAENEIRAEARLLAVAPTVVIA